MRKCIFYLMFLMSLQLMQAQTSSIEDDVKRFLARAKTAYGMGESKDAGCISNCRFYSKQPSCSDF